MAEVSVFINCWDLFLFLMDLRQGNGQSTSVVVLPFEVAPTLVLPGSGSGWS